MPGRSYSATNSYRYGFNGKENDNEVKGEGNEIDYGARVYDSRIGRFLSVDPLQTQYPELTTYQYTSNNPIAGVDLDGREFEWFMLEKLEKHLFGTTYLKSFSEGFTERAISTVKGMTNGNVPEPLKNLMPNMRLATTDPNVAKQNTSNMFKSAKVMTDAMAEGVKHTAKELADLTKKAINGDVKAMGALGFEAVMFVLPGGEEIDAIKAGSKTLKFSGESIHIFESIVKNSAGKRVTRTFVKTEDDLLKIAEDAAGGSLDNFTEIKPNYYQGEINGKKLRIEWQPGGEPHMGHGPHVKIEEWVPGAGKKGKGQWKTTDKYFQIDANSLQKIQNLQKIDKAKTSG